MLLPILVVLSSLFQGLNSQAVDINGITLAEKVEEVERQMLNPFTLFNVVTPCSINFNGNQSAGEQTSAEWVRIVFHDMITANVAGPGLGGLDASIGFESERAENPGIFINVTLGQFSQFSSVFLSMSDLIGIGLSDALTSCEPTTSTVSRIPLQVGRIDATGPGPSGVPGPTDSLAVATAAFATARFNQSEMIQAVACGHSLGGVHKTNFSLIVEPPLVAVGIDGRASFDSTPAVFDNTGVNEYLNGTGLAGGPLVVGPNITARSDLRIFSSDGNATIRAMSSPQSFREKCFTIFQKMMNTVPAGTTLSDPIAPRPWILSESHLDLNTAGGVVYSGTILAHSTPAPPKQASYNYGLSTGANTSTELSAIGAPFPNSTFVGLLGETVNFDLGFGTITTYTFNDTLNNPKITSINIVGSSYSAPINQNLFILPSQSFSNLIKNPSGSKVVENQLIIRAAVLSTLAPTGSTELLARIWYPEGQPGTMAPRILNTSVKMAFKETLGSYKIYQVVITVGDGVSGLFGTTVVQAKLGTSEVFTEVSAKLKTFAWLSCSNPTLTDC